MSFQSLQRLCSTSRRPHRPRDDGRGTPDLWGCRNERYGLPGARRAVFSLQFERGRVQHSNANPYCTLVKKHKVQAAHEPPSRSRTKKITSDIPRIEKSDFSILQNISSGL